MKKILSLSILLIICSLGYSQETNTELLKKAEIEMQTAVEKEDYDKAAQLKKEIGIRKQITEAVEKGDYETASKLKKELEGKPNTNNSQPTDEINVSTSMGSTGFVKPDSGKVAVYFVRKNFYATVMRMNIFDSLQLIGGVIGASYTRYECEPGAHMFWMWSENNDHKVYIPATLEANKTYIIEVYAAPATNKERKLAGKKARNYPYTLYVEGISPSDKRMEKLISYVKKEKSRSYPADVLKRLNMEFELEIRQASVSFEDAHKKGDYLSAKDYIPYNLLEL